MSFRTLKSIFHEYNESKMKDEYKRRFNSLASFNTNINITPMVNGKKVVDKKYPLFFMVTKNLSKKQELISLNSREIDSALNSVPHAVREQYFNDLLIDELQSTNEIENVFSTKKEIAHTLNNKSSEFLKFRGLVDQYKEIEHSQKIRVDSVKDIREIYDKLVSREINEQDKLDGNLFRKNFVGVHDASTNKYMHVGLEPETKIIEYIGEMLTFLKYFDAPQPFKIMASHYLFEYIHPFYDGNGRVGRFIIAKLLSDYYDNYTALTFSYVINRNKSKYYKAFMNASNHLNCGDLTGFIEIMLDLLIVGQDRILDDLVPKMNATEKLTRCLSNHYKKVDYEFLYLLSMDKLFGNKRNRLSLIDIENILGVGRVKINNTIKKYNQYLVKIKSRPAIYEISNEFLNMIIK
ncbi:TPA: Fic family protein [Staphylococcus argenteus]|uniref:Fic family protein n=1 Tax=Staphylococcus argenteus TaxID=985002 RepID=UPI00050388D0|nr:Fic family protein [Staphylococcus argenteus]MBE2136137.1 Fic family protein [Staphylococcus argenteus]MDT3004458.1 Fic family protein [Staphylococcus argenteus]UPO19864.1 Fic family protein [Staphylococcus argenteus]CDR63408.1 phage protein [Staphylococcus argenteus]HDY9445678.1 Fic family protein [Staphylococcus argenteus]